MIALENPTIFGLEASAQFSTKIKEVEQSIPF